MKSGKYIVLEYLLCVSDKRGDWKILRKFKTSSSRFLSPVKLKKVVNNDNEYDNI